MEESVRPEESASPEQSVRPAESIRPAESAGSGESVRPEESIRPAESIMPEAGAGPEISAGQLGIPALLASAKGPMKLDPKSASAQTLAFLGDAVYSLLVRTLMVRDGSSRADRLHKKTAKLVCAAAQAEMADFWQELLTEEEKDVYRRGKNAKTDSHAKNASIYDYHKATGLEVLAGYLYLTDRMDRLTDLVLKGIERQL